MLNKEKLGIAVILGVVILVFTAPYRISQKIGSLPTPSIYPPKEVSGILNSSINQDNIDETLCNPNWSTKSIRPDSSYTTKLKIKQLKELGYADQNPAHYEEDHLISLQLGGHPTAINNLWPESYLTTPNARDKDKLENYLHFQVCIGQLTLSRAQDIIANDWYNYYLKVGLDKKLSGVYIDEDDE